MKRRLILVRFILAAVILFEIGSSAVRTDAADDGPLRVFVLVGGSNMGGHWSKIDELPRELSDEQPDALLFDGMRWTPLSPEKVKGKGFGPEISFAHHMSRKLRCQIGIIKHSGSGTSLATAWSPAVPDSLYWQLIDQVRAARQTRAIKIEGCLMVQGSGDSKEQKRAEAYADNLKNLIQAARKDMQSPDMPFVCTRLRAGQPTAKYPYASLVRKAQEAGSEYIDCDTFPVVEDNVHFTTQGQIELGRRFADKLHSMMKQGDNR